jgi:hypothetical protein
MFTNTLLIIHLSTLDVGLTLASAASGEIIASAASFHPLVTSKLCYAMVF